MARKVIVYLVLVMLSVINVCLETRAEADSKVNVKGLIVKHSMEMGIDPAIALSIAKAESGFCHHKKSPYGAIGVFQLMPSTAKRLGYNPYHIQDNIKAGIAYYKMMYKMFGTMELALAAYNAGPGNVKKYNGVPPFAETKKFVSKIMNNYTNLKHNPDPIISNYKSGFSDINYFEEAEEKIIEEYLANQGI